MSVIDYQLSAKARARHEAAALDESKKIVRESSEQFLEHLSWLLCDLRSEQLHTETQINEFEAVIREAVKAVEV